MKFKVWIKKFINDDSPMGDLAKDIYDDRMFPESNSKRILKDHLMDKGACKEARETFDCAWIKYKEIQKGEEK